MTNYKLWILVKIIGETEMKQIKAEALEYFRKKKKEGVVESGTWGIDEIPLVTPFSEKGDLNK